MIIMIVMMMMVIIIIIIIIISDRRVARIGREGMHNIAKCSQQPWEWGTSWEKRPHYLHGFQLQ
jgi:hypothetical protein